METEDNTMKDHSTSLPLPPQPPTPKWDLDDIIFRGERWQASDR